MKENGPEKSFGELPTMGHEAPERTERSAALDGPSWTELGLSEATTLKPPEGSGGIVDDGRTDGARRWKAGETILNRYVVEGELGQGGMGVVYGCLDKVGGVRVAVKCLPPELGHNSVEMEEVRENFGLVCGLAHPNIAVVRQLEKDGKGEYYLVMELAEGASLRRWLRRKWKAGGVSLAEAVGVLRQVASALDYAHGEKVVHRDVKPGNVMVDGKGRVKVLDFGLAAQIRTSLSRASHAYRGTSGTGPYMAPEQWRAQPQDAKTDQYALGVMAYEMLAGRLPFENPELAVLKDAVLNGEPPDIAGVPPRAMAAIRRAMAKRAEERFGSCAEFVEALEGKRTAVGGQFPPAPVARSPEAAAAVGLGGGGDVFLLKVRLGNALREADRGTDATAGEKAELERVREVFAAGEEAIKAGDRTAAERLFLKGEAKMGDWRKGLEARRQRERAEEAARDALARKRAEAAEALARKRAEAAEALARKRAEAAEALARKRAEERAARRRAGLKRAAKMAGVAALAWALVWGMGWVGRPMANLRTRKAVAGMGQGTRAGEETTIPIGWNSRMAFVWCPPGSFTMGSPAGEEGREKDETQHQVTLSKGFWLAKTEVTQKQWKSVMGSNPSYFEGDNRPVECVGWEDCQAFCRKTGLALPTEAQWEYACRAGTGTAYFWGNALNGDKANCDGNYPCGTTVKGPDKGTTTPVGSYAANAWGLYDMHGNVWEWCADWYGPYPSGAVTDPPGPSTGSNRVHRGGSWSSNARSCRSANRSELDPGYRVSYLGLRVALLPDQ